MKIALGSTSDSKIEILKEVLSPIVKGGLKFQRRWKAVGNSGN